ncbi:MAG: cytochrome c oxidase subunit II [Actinobacteria bacterium]|nr:cytochrome c oxidase subunit II [Actinomycetota bacterium]
MIERITSHPRLGRWVSLGAVTSMALLSSGCGYLQTDDAPLNSLNPQGTQSQTIHDLVTPVFAVAGVVFVVVQALIVFMAFKFRRRKNDVDGIDEPTQTHGIPKLEWAWTIAPAVLLAFLAVFNVQAIWELEKRDDPNMISVEVYGQQWWWEYRYDVDSDGEIDIITANQMVVPAGTLIDLDIRSNDVIHSFWIPTLNGKKDAVPGRTHHWTIQAHKPGLYEGTCTEFCGLSHAHMRMEVKAVTTAEYEQWVEEQTAPANIPEDPTPDDSSDDDLVLTGYKAFVASCATCHQLNGIDELGAETDGTPNADYRGADHPLTSGNAPNLTHLMSRNRFAGNLFSLWELDEDGNYTDRVDESTLGNWLRNPENMKQMAAGENRGMPNLQLSQDQIDALVAFLATLK